MRRAEGRGFFAIATLRSRKCSQNRGDAKSDAVVARKSPHEVAPKNSAAAKNISRRRTCDLLRLRAVSCERETSSPSRIALDRVFLRGNGGSSEKATQNPTQWEVRMKPQEPHAWGR